MHSIGIIASIQANMLSKARTFTSYTHALPKYCDWTTVLVVARAHNSHVTVCTQKHAQTFSSPHENAHSVNARVHDVITGERFHLVRAQRTRPLNAHTAIWHKNTSKNEYFTLLQSQHVLGFIVHKYADTCTRNAHATCRTPSRPVLDANTNKQANTQRRKCKNNCS